MRALGDAPKAKIKVKAGSTVRNAALTTMSKTEVKAAVRDTKAPERAASTPVAPNDNSVIELDVSAPHLMGYLH